MGKFLAYLRVSTENQGEIRAGLAAQLAACRSHAEKCKSSLADVFKDEGATGACGSEKHPALVEAISRLDKDDILLVAKRDCLGRDPIGVAMIERAVAGRGARIVSASGEGTEENGPSNIGVRQMMNAFAEYERLIASEKAKEGLEAWKRKRELVETRRRLWQNSWHTLLDEMERSGKDGS